MRSILVVTSLGLLACSSSKKVVGADAADTVDSDTSCPGQASYAGPLDQSRGGLIECINGAGSYDSCPQPAGMGTAQQPELIVGQGDFNTQDTLEIDVYRLGLFQNGFMPAQLNLDAQAEHGFQDCFTCVIVDVGFVPGQGFSDQYLATSGSLNITAISGSPDGTDDGRITGTLTDATFAHVEINTTTNTSTVVDDCTVTIPSIAFDQPTLVNPSNFATPKLAASHHAKH